LALNTGRAASAVLERSANKPIQIMKSASARMSLLERVWSSTPDSAKMYTPFPPELAEVRKERKYIRIEEQTSSKSNQQAVSQTDPPGNDLMEQ
jgi:hypothetical protein